MATIKEHLVWKFLVSISLGVVISIFCTPRLIGFILGTSLVILLTPKTSWRDNFRTGAFAGAVIGMIATGFLLPNEFISPGISGFQFFDSLLLALLFAALGGGILGGINGMLIGEIIKRSRIYRS